MKKILALAILAVSINCSFAADDEGYFLSFSQKGQLVWRGEILGDDGNWYNIRIVPGYVAPSKCAWEGWGDGVDSFGEYFGSKKYKDIAKDSGDVYEWAFDKCIWKFVIKGAPEAWSEYFGAAGEKVEKRIFGWPMAYPVAFFQALGDNIFRIPVGITGCALGTTAGTAIVPGYHMMNSTFKGGFYFIGPGMILPISGYTWNTIIAPPLALTGQKPSEARIDGYWVTKMSQAEFEARSRSIDDSDMKQIADWGRMLLDKLGRYDDERAKTYKDTSRKVREAYDEQARKINELESQEKTEFQKLKDMQENKAIVDILREKNIDNYTISSNSNRIKAYLVNSNMTEAQADKIVNMLRKYSDFRRPVEKFNPDNKTDPVRESIKVIDSTTK